MEQRYGRELEEANLAVKRVALDNDSIALIILLSDYMREKLISVTEAARNFADCVNRAHYQNVTFVLLKNGLPFARLTPDHAKVCVGRDLAEALAKTELPANEARAWHRDLKAARKILKAPADRWR